jgi:diaminopimelate decarboxylase
MHHLPPETTALTVGSPSGMTADAWRELTGRAVALVGTPCYVVSAPRIHAALDELSSYTGRAPVRHWLSLKTLPMRPLVELWRDWGLGVEVVSPFELAAALGTGLPPERILVNGTAKHRWLVNVDVPHLNVHFDSLAEIGPLKPLARARHWRVGLRCQVTSADRRSLDHFGMTLEETVSAAAQLREAGVSVSGVHVHIRMNVSAVAEFEAALSHARKICDAAAIEPEYVDIGGGLPVHGERPVDGSVAACDSFDLQGWSRWLATLKASFPMAREIWLENGRFVTARAGALAMTVIDRKERDDVVYAICDAGRTNHARLSTVEFHDVVVDPERDGPTRPTIVCGPTCGAVDRLGQFTLPETLRAGDRLLWMNAGAYAIPLETRFSFGLAPVVWRDMDGALHVVRARETAEQWWAQWQ